MTLVVVPAFVRDEDEASVTIKCLETLRDHEPDVAALVVDDGSPSRESWGLVRDRCDDLGIEWFEKDENSGFSKTVNVGLRRALASGSDAILCNADIEFTMPFVDRMADTPDSSERPAAVVGALLFYPNGLIQHSGIFLSFLSRAFDHRFRFAPGGLPEAHQPSICPVTGALQFIRHGTLESVGLYDEDFSMSFEDVDYCLRVFDAGLECVYNPNVKAVHHESLFRGSATGKLAEWQSESLVTLHKKHGKTPLGRWVPRIA